MHARELSKGNSRLLRHFHGNVTKLVNHAFFIIEFYDGL